MTKGELQTIRTRHQCVTVGGITHDAYVCSACHQHYPCDAVDLVDELEAATRVIAAVQARRLAFVEYNRVRSESASADEWELVRNAYHNALVAENQAIAEWEKLNDANQSNAT